MLYDQEGDPNFDAWFSQNQRNFPKELVDFLKEHYDTFHFLFSIYRKILKHLDPAMHELMLKHYPVFRTEQRPAVLEYLDDLPTLTCDAILIKIYHLWLNQKAGKNIRDSFPDIDKWRDFYGKPKTPDTIDESTRPDYTWISDAEWEQYRDSENASLLEFFNWEEKRKFEFVDLVQTYIFKYYKEIENLNPDEWIVYAMIIRDEYEYFKTICENIELLIDCKMPEKYVDCPIDEFQQAYSSIDKEVKDRATEFRNRRIAGEEI